MSAAPRFADLARAALKKHVPESALPDAARGEKPNEAWVRFRLDDGRYAGFAIRRHLDWVTGEFGLSWLAADFDALDLVQEETDPRFAAPEPSGGRIRLGVLMHGDDRWWPAAAGDALVERIEWIALQLRARSERFMHLPRDGGAS